LFIVFIAVAGPLFAPHSPSAIVGPSDALPSSLHWLGTDFLGRDVLSRVLYGGWTVLTLAGSATLLGYLIGIPIGLVAGHVRSTIDPVLMRIMDVLLAFPPILLLLVLATGAGPNRLVLVCGVAVTHVPGIARTIRAATLDVSVRGFVEAAQARGERLSYILGREVLPNISPTVLADMGIRFTGSILLIASVNFLGLGMRPPSSDWALMISENRMGMMIQPWAAVVPALLIGCLTIAANLIADAVTRGLAVSADFEAEQL
jgi:ABC-type dipeptide/oligopeptide/nickel transport system permease subunit